MTGAAGSVSRKLIDEDNTTNDDNIHSSGCIKREINFHASNITNNVWH